MLALHAAHPLITLSIRFSVVSIVPKPGAAIDVCIGTRYRKMRICRCWMHIANSYFIQMAQDTLSLLQATAIVFLCLSDTDVANAYQRLQRAKECNTVLRCYVNTYQVSITSHTITETPWNHFLGLATVGFRG